MVMIAMLLLAYAAMSIVFLVVAIVGFWKKKTWLKLLGGIPFTLLVVLATVVTIFGAINYIQSITPEGSFRQSFGFEASKETTLYDGSYSVMFDSGSAEAIFSSAAKTRSRIIGDGFQPISRQSFMDKYPSHFWQRIVSSNSVQSELAYFEKSPFRDFLTDDTALIVVNTNTGLTFSTWHGTD